MKVVSVKLVQDVSGLLKCSHRLEVYILYIVWFPYYGRLWEVYRGIHHCHLIIFPCKNVRWSQPLEHRIRLREAVYHMTRSGVGTIRITSGKVKCHLK